MDNRDRRGKVPLVCVATLLVLVSFGDGADLWAQASESSQPGLAVRNGIVEAELGSGDMKPARFAKVYAIPSAAAVPLKNAVISVAKALDDVRSKAEDYPQKEMVELQCITGLLKLRLQLAQFEQAAAGDSGKTLGVVVTEADEIGEFTLKGLNSETYTVFAVGKVGMNGAIWLLDSDPSSSTERLKLTRAEIACYDPNGLFRP